MLDFLKAWGQFQVEGHSHNRVLKNTLKQYNRLKKRINDQKGYLVEVYIAQILWNGQQKTFAGKYFHQKEDVIFPHQFYTIHHRVRLSPAAGSEVDVYAFSGEQIWVCESKWWQTQKVGVPVVEKLIGLTDKVKAFEGPEYFEGERPLIIKMWLFAHNGVTAEAETLLNQHHIYWSTRSDLDALIEITGLRPLPQFKNNNSELN